MKGSAATFGLHELSRLAAALERNAAKVTPAEYANALDRLDAAYAASRAQLPVLAAA